MRPFPPFVALAALVAGGSLVLLAVTFGETCGFPVACAPASEAARLAWYGAPFGLHLAAAAVAGYAARRHGWGPLSVGALVLALVAAEATLNFGGRDRQYDVPAAGMTLGILAFGSASAALAKRDALGRAWGWVMGIGFGGLVLAFRVTLMREMTSLPLVSRYPVLVAAGFAIFLVALAVLVTGSLLTERDADRRTMGSRAAAAPTPARIGASVALAAGASVLVTLASNRTTAFIECHGGACPPPVTEPSLEVATLLALGGLTLLASAVAAMVVQRDDMVRPGAPPTEE